MKKFLKIFIVFVIIVLVELLLLFANFKHSYPKELIKTKRVSVNCNKKIINNDDFKFCSNEYDTKYYNDTFLKIDSLKEEINYDKVGNVVSKIYVNESENPFYKRVVEYNYTNPDGNKISEFITDYDKDNKEIGSIKIFFNMNHQVLSYTENGTFGNFSEESFIDNDSKRVLVIQLKENSNTPIIKRIYNE